MRTSNIEIFNLVITDTYANVKDTKIEDAIIADRNITGCKFDNIIFEGIEFINCNFQSTEITNCKFINCKFIGCNFKFTKFNNCNLISCMTENCYFCITNSLNCNFLSCTYINNEWIQSNASGSFITEHLIETFSNEILNFESIQFATLSSELIAA